MITTMVQVPIYTVIVHEAEEGGYWGEVLELPGCVSQGETLEEFKHNIREAIEAVLQSQATEPALAEKDAVQFTLRAPRDRLVRSVEASETWTAAQ